VGILNPLATMSRKNSTQHFSLSLLPTARCKSTLRPSVVRHQAARELPTQGSVAPQRLVDSVQKEVLHLDPGEVALAKKAR
jgi:hypothetical protein